MMVAVLVLTPFTFVHSSLGLFSHTFPLPCRPHWLMASAVVDNFTFHLHLATCTEMCIFNIITLLVINFIHSPAPSERTSMTTNIIGAWNRQLAI